jgi:S1-C subfamily serine protease
MRSTVTAAMLGGIVSAAVVVLTLLATGSLGGEDDDGAPADAVAEAVEAGPSTRQIYRTARSAVVRVDARPRGTPIPKGRPQPDDGVATGTGFVIASDGSIVTNDHVVAGGPLVSVRFREGARRVRARVVGRDASSDLALLKIDAGAMPLRTEPLPLGDSRRVKVGDAAIAVGNPFGLEHTLTVGVVSAVDREIEAPNGEEIKNAVQTDAAINPGNSGGPLLDAHGRVIGVTSQAEAAGIAYAVPVDRLKQVVPRLEREGRR